MFIKKPSCYAAVRLRGYRAVARSAAFLWAVGIFLSDLDRSVCRAGTYLTNQSITASIHVGPDEWRGLQTATAQSEYRYKDVRPTWFRGGVSEAWSLSSSLLHDTPIGYTSLELHGSSQMGGYNSIAVDVGGRIEEQSRLVYSPFSGDAFSLSSMAFGLQNIYRVGKAHIGGQGYSSVFYPANSVLPDASHFGVDLTLRMSVQGDELLSRVFVTAVGAPTAGGEVVVHDTGYLGNTHSVPLTWDYREPPSRINFFKERYFYAVIPGPEPSSYAASINTPASATQTQAEAGYPRITTATSVTKTGPGTLVMDNANPYTGTTTVSEGTLTITNPLAVQSSPLIVRGGGIIQLPKNTPIVVPTKTIEVDVASGGRIDVGVGLINCFPPNGAGDGWLVDWISAGRDGGSWQGAGGITSSAVVDDAAEGKPRAVGWKKNEDGSVTVGYAAPGDTNLDGEVNIFDLVNVNSSGTYGRGVPSNWSQGDFDYNGVTNIFDIVMVNGAGVYGRGRYVPAPASGSVAAVPEPSTCIMALAGIAYGGHVVRRRRKQA